MTKAQRKAAMRASSADIAKRFPKGGNDPLGGQMTLGNQYRSVNNLQFGLIKTGAAKHK